VGWVGMDTVPLRLVTSISGPQMGHMKRVGRRVGVYVGRGVIVGLPVEFLSLTGLAVGMSVALPTGAYVGSMTTGDGVVGASVGLDNGGSVGLGTGGSVGLGTGGSVRLGTGGSVGLGTGGSIGLGTGDSVGLGTGGSVGLGTGGSVGLGTGGSVELAATAIVIRMPRSQCVPTSQINNISFPASSRVKVYVAGLSSPTITRASSNPQLPLG
jgi:hypothetical protein